jgi:ribosomal protein S2
MKIINNGKIYKNKILKLRLIKTKIYKKNPNTFIKLEDISSRLKKFFSIVYNYHINNKKILFIGTPINIPAKFKKAIAKTNHIFLPESVWLSGILTNHEACVKYLSKNPKSIDNKISEIFFKMQKKCDLVVVLNFFSNQKPIVEAYLARIPIICLNCNLNITDQILSYKVPGNFKFRKKKVRNILTYAILQTIFKKYNKC